MIQPGDLADRHATLSPAERHMAKARGALDTLRERTNAFAAERDRVDEALCDAQYGLVPIRAAVMDAQPDLERMVALARDAPDEPLVEECARRAFVHAVRARVAAGCGEVTGDV